MYFQAMFHGMGCIKAPYLWQVDQLFYGLLIDGDVAKWCMKKIITGGRQADERYAV